MILAITLYLVSLAGPAACVGRPQTAVESHSPGGDRRADTGSPSKVTSVVWGT